MSFDFGEGEEWNSLLLKAEIAASTSRLSDRKEDRVLAQKYFNALVSSSKFNDGKARALAGLALCHCRYKRYEIALTTAKKACEAVKRKNDNSSACHEYVKCLAKETYNFVAREYNKWLSSRRRKR